MDELQAKILGYKPSHEAIELLANNKILLLVGPTGSGKNTLEKELLKDGRFKPIVTHTTRAPRYNHGVKEIDGDEYHFVSVKQALNMLDKQLFIEVAFTHGNLYGTSLEEFRLAKNEGKIAVADIDIKGVRSYRQLTDKVTAVFLLPPSFKILLNRLITRYGQAHDEEDIKVRLATALDELAELIDTNYYLPIINNNIELTTKTVLAVINNNQKIKPDPKALNLAQCLINDIKKYLRG